MHKIKGPASDFKILSLQFEIFSVPNTIFLMFSTYNFFAILQLSERKGDVKTPTIRLKGFYRGIFWTFICFYKIMKDKTILIHN